VPGLCGLIALDGSPREAASRAILASMIETLSHDDRYVVLDRLELAGVNAAVVAYPSPVFRGIRARGHCEELWYGTIDAGRSIVPDERGPEPAAARDEAPDGSKQEAASRRLPPSPAGPTPRQRWRFAEDLGGGAADTADGLARLCGSFCGLRVHPREGRYELFTDPISSMPLFYRIHQGLLLFAPEAKALLAPDPSGWSADPRSLSFFLTAGYLPPSRHWFEQVQPLPPATMLTGRLGPAGAGEPPRRKVYWSFRFRAAEERSEAALASHLAATIEEVVASQRIEGARTGVLLSGGYDSRGIFGAMLRRGLAFSTVTWGHEPDLPESDAVVARALASEAGVAHRFELLDPHALPRHAAEWVWQVDGAVDSLYNYPQGDGIFRSLAADLDVLVRGDECFGMKWPYGVPDERTALSCIGLFPFAWHAVLERVVQRDARVALAAEGERAFEELRTLAGSATPRDRKDEYYFAVRFQGYLNRVNYYKLRVLAVRNPLLDRRILDFALELPGRHRQSKSLFRQVVRERLAPFPSVPFAQRTSLIPWRKIAREDRALAGLLRSHLLEGPLARQGLWDRGAMERQLQEWLDTPPGSVEVPPVGTEAGAATPGGARAGSRSGGVRLASDLGKRLAYHPWMPSSWRSRLLPSKNPRRPFPFAFRLLAVSLYAEALESRGIRVAWL